MELDYGFQIDFAQNKTPTYIFYMDPPPIKTFVFKGARTRSFVYRKFLEIADNRGILSSVDEVGGSSSGVFAAAFACVPYKDFHKRTDALDLMVDTRFDDIISNSRGGKIYRFLSSPLLLVSELLFAVSNMTQNIAQIFNKISFGKILGYPLKLASFILKVASKIISPEFFAGIYNLITLGGVYRGDNLYHAFRDRFRQDVEAGLHTLLEKFEPKERTRIESKLINIGLCKNVGNKLNVIPDITYKHLYELSQIPESQFKQLYTTSVRMSNNKLMIYNHKKTPNLPIHQGIRLGGLSIPRVFVNQSLQGVHCMDGSIVDDYAMKHASRHPVSPLQKQHGITDNLSILGIRAEHPDEFNKSLTKLSPNELKQYAKASSANPPKLPLKVRAKHFIRQVKNKIKNQIYKRFYTNGVDFAKTQALSTELMQEQFAQRTLQMSSVGIDGFEVITDGMKYKQDKISAKEVNFYFDQHIGEKAVIIHYQQPTDDTVPDEKSHSSILQKMPTDKQLMLLDFLEQATYTPSLTNVSEEEWERFRVNEIARLREFPTIIRALEERTRELSISTSTARILSQTRAESPTPSPRVSTSISYMITTPEPDSPFEISEPAQSLMAPTFNHYL